MDKRINPIQDVPPKMDGMDKLDKPPRFVHDFGWEIFPNSLLNCFLVSLSERRPRTLTELFSSVYIIFLASTVTTCVIRIHTDPPICHVPRRVQNSAPHPSQCLHIIGRTPWPQSPTSKSRCRMSKTLVPCVYSATAPVHLS